MRARTHPGVRSARSFALAIIACIGANACGSVVRPKACTEIGCQSGLAVHLETMPVGAYRVEVLTAAGVAGPHVYECAGGASCLKDVFFATYSETSASVRVTTALGVRTTQFSGIAYVILNPNGDECPPVCKQGSVTVPLPA